jgi:hypothetical protein
MIRAILLVGWLGMLLLLVTGLEGYRVVDDDTARRHLMTSIFTTGALLFVDVCLLVYLLGTQRMVRRTAAELALAGSWAADRLPLTRRGALLGGLAAAAIGTTFGLGFPTFTGVVDAWVHHGVAAAAAVLQVATLLVGAAVLRRGEAQLVDLGKAAETVRYTPPAVAAGAGSTPRGHDG